MNNNQIKFLTYGTTTLTIKEEYSGIVHKIKFNIQNVVEIDEITPFSFKNDNYTYNNDTDYYCFNSGEANQLSFNFLSTSTYSTITYTSSNEDVIIINEDGTITPLNEGKAIITAKINDQNGVNIIYQIKVQVKSKKLITNMNTFLHYVRKGIGHFGAFFVLGIFSTNFYITYFDKKKWYASIPFNYLQGIFIALVSELIQVYVPGRSGRMKDVLIDTCGFLLSSTIITITIIILYLIPLIQARKKIKSKK
jgi:VanZ family protein